MAILAKEKILTLDYWKPASQIEVGDYLFDRLGKLVRVTSIQHYVPKQCFRAQFSDLMEISGDSKMGLPTENFKHRLRQSTYKGKYKFRRPLKALSLEELSTLPLRDKRNRRALSVPTCGSLQLPMQDLPVHPFVFGFWFRNKTRTGHFTIRNSVFDFFKKKMQDCGYSLENPKEIRYGYIRFKISPSIESQLMPFIPTQIPNNYLLASEEQRLELLRGLIIAKSRQYIAKNNSFCLSFQNWHTPHTLQGLVESLGCKTTMEYDEYVKCYRLKFKTWHDIHPDQKLDGVKVYQTRRYIEKITEIQPQMCTHIETDGEDGSFLAGEGFISCR